MKSKAAEYFRQRPFGRIMELLRKRFVELSDTGGTVALPEPTREEATALRDFFGSLPKKKADGSVVLSLREFDEELRFRSAFPCTLREAMEAYFGEVIVTRKEAQASEAAQWDCFLERMSVSAPAELLPFLADVRSDWKQHGPAMEESLLLVFRAVVSLPARRGASERLPVFANRVAGDPHAFDPDRLAGRLLVRALAAVLPIAAAGTESDAAWRGMLLAAAGLDRDDVSSTVLAVGLVGEDPLLRAARETGASLAYPLRTVQGWMAVRAHRGVAFVVENPAVFGAFLDRWRDAGVAPTEWPTVICTSGQLSAAAVVLLDRLVKGGTGIRYSGDFDIGGLRIARGLLRQYGAAIRLWRMDAEAYRLAVAEGGRPLKDTELRALAGLSAEFPDLVRQIEQVGQAGYQEALTGSLWEDLRGTE